MEIILHHFCIYASQTDWLFCFLPSKNYPAFCGAKLASEIKAKILQRIELRFVKCPAVMRLDKNELDKIINLIKNW